MIKRALANIAIVIGVGVMVLSAEIVIINDPPDFGLFGFPLGAMLVVGGWLAR